MSAEPKCPGCGATLDELRFIGKGNRAILPGLEPIAAYQCQKCGLGFTFNPTAPPTLPPPADPPDWKPENLPER